MKEKSKKRIKGEDFFAQLWRLDWDYIFAQLKGFYGCSKDEFKKMSLHEVFSLLEDGKRLIKAETGKGISTEDTSSLSTVDKKRLIEMAKERNIELPKKGL